MEYFSEAGVAGHEGVGRGAEKKNPPVVGRGRGEEESCGMNRTMK